MSDYMSRLAAAIYEHSELEREAMEDIARHGADAGWGGFCYTADCVEFYEANEADIWEMAREQADEMGHANTAEMFATFGRSDMLDDPDSFKNLLAWYALEEVARRVADGDALGVGAWEVSDE